jgi:hypothetical protein
MSRPQWPDSINSLSEDLGTVRFVTAPLSSSGGDEAAPMGNGSRKACRPREGAHQWNESVYVAPTPGATPHAAEARASNQVLPRQLRG